MTGRPPTEPAPTPAAPAARSPVLRVGWHRSVLPLGARARVIGLDPVSAVVVDDLPPAVAALFDDLGTAVDRRHLVQRAVEHGLPHGAVEALLHRLVEVGALIDAAAVDRRARARAASTAVVVGRGPLTVGVVVGLAQAGLGAVHVETGGTVRGDDLGTGWQECDLGTDRLAATRAALHRLAPGAATGSPPLRHVPDLVVLADEGPDPARVARLMVDGVAHLPVRLRDGVGVVGPLVLPHRSACLQCVELHRAAHDPTWPAVAAQLVGRRGRADAACLQATVGLAVAQALAALDGTGCAAPAPAALETTLELDVTAGAVLRRRWLPSTACRCRAVGDARSGYATSAGTGPGETIAG